MLPIITQGRETIMRTLHHITEKLNINSWFAADMSFRTQVRVVAATFVTIAIIVTGSLTLVVADAVTSGGGTTTSSTSSTTPAPAKPAPAIVLPTTADGMAAYMKARDPEAYREQCLSMLNADSPSSGYMTFSYDYTAATKGKQVASAMYVWQSLIQLCVKDSGLMGE